MQPGGTRQPLVFLDVDGVLLPFRGRSARPDRPWVEADDGSGNPLLDRLDPGDGRRLLALSGELVWASTWMAEANEVISPRLGLPVLPFVDWPDPDEQPERGLHWKTAFLTRWAAGRPFVWLDDETTDADRRWVAARHPWPALLHRVDPYMGLTDADFSAVRQWLGRRNEPA
ncbi:HAD domain-containing protein [Dactylosporangium fulvum]|uniref:HAD domain-containing protein n=1 Tax=Dactylosporangium fulvum TaxID=53359 RepID=A0ABY5W1N3_9ACTN|nr:HAD domain-containing protein [Dactylosporangium fulvum]UWP83364.1 HAD domain-containing protein [Dactylosporangium fulvum]